MPNDAKRLANKSYTIRTQNEAVPLKTLSLTLLVVSAVQNNTTHEDNSYPRYQGSGNCSNAPCDYEVQFCGLDDRCHYYSCQEWYDFGPPEFTGHDDGRSITFLSNFSYVTNDNGGDASAAPLECEYEVPSSDVYSAAIVYGCTFWSCSGDLCSGYTDMNDPREGVAQDFTQRCSATNGNLSYVCYDLAEETDLDQFLVNVEGSIVNCSNELVPEPKFLFSIHLQTIFLYVSGGASSEILNETMVRSAMHSMLQESHSDEARSVIGLLLSVFGFTAGLLFL